MPVAQRYTTLVVLGRFSSPAEGHLSAASLHKLKGGCLTSSASSFGSENPPGTQTYLGLTPSKPIQFLL